MCVGAASVIASYLRSLTVDTRNKWHVPNAVCLCSLVCLYVTQSCCLTRKQKGWMMSSFWCSSSTPRCASRNTNSAKSVSWLDDWRTSTLNSAPLRRFHNTHDNMNDCLLGCLVSGLVGLLYGKMVWMQMSQFFPLSFVSQFSVKWMKNT